MRRCPYEGSRNIIAALTVGAWGCAFLALFIIPLVAVVIVTAWGMGLLTGMHVQSIREHRWHEPEEAS